MSIIISGSEGETFNTCERSHYYKFALGLEPKRFSHFIRIGVVGHKVLETYYRCAMETNNDRKAMYLAAVDELANFISRAQDEEEHDVIDIVSSRINQYMSFYKDTWRVLDVEGKYFMPITENINYGMTLDLLVEETSGPYRGQAIVIDHKFCYNFFSPEELSMNAQMPRYISTLKHLGFDVRRGILNQVRYRADIKDPTKFFKRAYIKPSEHRLEAIMEEQRRVSETIHERVSLPVSVYRDISKRSMSRRNCGSCHFRLPCSLELDGKDMDASRVLSLDYVENSYGYRG